VSRIGTSFCDKKSVYFNGSVARIVGEESLLQIGEQTSDNRSSLKQSVGSTSEILATKQAALTGNLGSNPSPSTNFVQVSGVNG